jgi:diadenosine tetraphosphate (Ap4A) HIT family hydrolase
MKTAPRSSRNDPPQSARACELCTQTGGHILWRDDRCRVILVDDADYAGFCRVVWTAHVKEMTDLNGADQQHCLRVVLAVEQALRNVLKPHKINLASFGNMTPHVHWHVIPRGPCDAHFPHPVWGEKQRETACDTSAGALPRLREQLAAELLNLL